MADINLSEIMSSQDVDIVLGVLSLTETCAAFATAWADNNVSAG
jgi:hypothetical protein